MFDFFFSPLTSRRHRINNRLGRALAPPLRIPTCLADTSENISLDPDVPCVRTMRA